MRKLTQPLENPLDVFDLCISKVRNIDLKQKLVECKPAINLAVNDYMLKAPDLQLHKIPEHDIINGNISSEEMIKVYTYRMVGDKSPGREIYDKYMNSASHNICPLCSQRPVSTLDHHLPKKKFPIYSVVPINIFPSCSDCNKIKSTFSPKSQEEEPIHPYFDNFEDDQWLFGLIVESKPATIKYFTEKPDNWDDLKYLRVVKHFKLLQLNKLFASQGAVELVNIYGQISDLYKSGGQELVKDHLRQCYKSRLRANVNSWQTAFYFALLNSDWYQNGGYAELL